ncbi:MAG: low molecular weight phosphotyrosine protein phosphatase [Eubacterium sp.]|nr:low molecular weight phosphotyrosine protein phosphatase [Eubacterium sp.]
MTKILFICHGNICRSTMAQSYFQNLINEKGLSEEFEINSAATHRDVLGSSPHYGTVEKLEEKGIPIVDHRATLMTKDDYMYYNYLIGMDSANIQDMNRISGGDPDKKIYKLLDFAGIKRDVADPWYTDDFDATWNDTVTGCSALFDHILQNENINI